jgi:two-component system, sensor histidine kinase YesM
MIKNILLDFFRKISIKTKLMCIASIFMLCPIIIIGYFGYVNYSNVMKDKAVSDSQNTARELSGMLSERMSKLNLFAIQIFYDQKIYAANNEYLSGNMDSFSQNVFQQYLQSILLSKNEFNEILVRFSKDNKTFPASRTSIVITDSELNIDALYNCALKGKGKPQWYVAYNEGRATGIYIAKLIFDLDEIKTITGVIALKVDEQYLFEVFNNFISHMKQNISLFSDSGQIIFNFENFETNSQQNLDVFLTSKEDMNLKEVKMKNDTAYLLYDTIHPADWKLMIGISENVLLKEVRNIAKLIVLLCIATIPICFLLINYSYIDLIKPLNLLIKRMRQIEKGDIGVIIESKRMDEFGYVFRTFNKMSQEIKYLIDTVYKKQIAMKDAEIKALQAQINPHFLYNTLESINWKAKINGVDEISDMISALSFIIEANLNRSNEKFVPIHREIEYINNYNFLIQKRFGDKIKFNLSVNDETLNFIIPKLVVQPIIENAIYHGLEMKKGGGIIDVAIWTENNILSITVSDNGLGIDEKILNKLNVDLSDEKFIGSEHNDGNSSKIGVLNVHRRLKLLYGEGYGLDISSEIGKGTTVMLKLPTDLPKER